MNTTNKKQQRQHPLPAANATKTKSNPRYKRLSELKRQRTLDELVSKNLTNEISGVAELEQGPRAVRAKRGAATERFIQCLAVPDRVWEQTVIPFWQAYRAMTEGKYSCLFRELGDLSTKPPKRDVDTATSVVETIDNAMQEFQDHITRKWNEHQRSIEADLFFGGE
jgi:hypothetical protein